MSPITFSEKRLRVGAWDAFLVLFLSFLSVLPLFSGGGQGAGEWVRIRTRQGEWRYRLSCERTVVVEGHHGRMLLGIEKGTVRVLTTDCPRKICKRRGRINRSGEEIICVPLRIEVLIEGRRRKGDVRCR